jgi:hypothetical protein
MHAPQSQALSEVQARRSQWCGDVEAALQSVLEGHRKLPPTQEVGEHPFWSEAAAAAHAKPARHWKPSVEQLAAAQPFSSAPIRVGAQTNPLLQAKSGPHVLGLQRPLVMSQVSKVAHEVAVQRETHIIPGPAAKLHRHGPAAGTQTFSGEQPPSPEHSCGAGRQMPQPVGC